MILWLNALPQEIFFSQRAPYTDIDRLGNFLTITPIFQRLSF